MFRFFVSDGRKALCHASTPDVNSSIWSVCPRSYLKLLLFPFSLGESQISKATSPAICVFFSFRNADKSPVPNSF